MRGISARRSYGKRKAYGWKEIGKSGSKYRLRKSVYWKPNKKKYQWSYK